MVSIAINISTDAKLRKSQISKIIGNAEHRAEALSKIMSIALDVTTSSSDAGAEIQEYIARRWVTLVFSNEDNNGYIDIVKTLETFSS